jgi:hypothetical protein
MGRGGQRARVQLPIVGARLRGAGEGGPLLPGSAAGDICEHEFLESEPDGGYPGNFPNFPPLCRKCGYEDV